MTERDQTDNDNTQSSHKVEAPISRDFNIARKVIVPLIKSNEITVSEAGLFLVMFVEESPLSINELVPLSHQSRPTVLDQLRDLQSQGIVESFRHGNEGQYRIAPATRLYSLEKKLTSGSVSYSSTSITSLTKKIIEDLNKVSGKHFRSDNLDTKYKIKARLGDGYTFQDFQKVHRNKLPCYMMKK
jgi:uncharacterized phage protein (TIGR02220 family)